MVSIKALASEFKTRQHLVLFFFRRNDYFYV